MKAEEYISKYCKVIDVFSEKNILMTLQQLTSLMENYSQVHESNNKH